MKRRLLASLLLLLCAATARAQPWRGAYYDCLHDGTPELRALDTPKLLDAGFDLFASQVRGQAVTDPNSVDAKWLDACKAAGAKVIVIPNALTPVQYQTLATKWAATVVGYHLQDDANNLTPAQITAAYNAIKPFLAGTTAYITVGKNTRHADYGGLVPWYHSQNYFGKAVTAGDGMKRYGYDAMLEARAAVPSTGKLFGAGAMGRSPTPYFGRRDPVWQSRDYANPYVQEAAIWLQLIAGADHILSYTAYSIANIGGTTYVEGETRIAERWDLLPGWRLINARIKGHERFLAGGARTHRYDAATKSVIGEWTLPSGEKLTVTVDLTSELFPRVSWLETPPPAPPVAGSFRFTVENGRIKAVELP